MARIFVALLLITVAAPLALAQADRKEALREELEGLEINPVMGTQLNLQLPFVDENGKKRKLADYFSPGKPVILTLGHQVTSPWVSLVPGMRASASMAARRLNVAL